MFSSANAVSRNALSLVVVEPKSNFGFLTALLPERALEALDVSLLVADDGVEEHLRLGVEEPAAAVVGLGLVVERRLEVLEGQGVVEDADVALAEALRRATATLALGGGGVADRRDESADQGPSADDGSAGDAGLLEEVEPRVALSTLAE